MSSSVNPREFFVIRRYRVPLRRSYVDESDARQSCLVRCTTRVRRCKILIRIGVANQESFVRPRVAIGDMLFLCWDTSHYTGTRGSPSTALLVTHILFHHTYLPYKPLHVMGTVRNLLYRNLLLKPLMFFFFFYKINSSQSNILMLLTIKQGS